MLVVLRHVGAKHDFDHSPVMRRAVETGEAFLGFLCRRPFHSDTRFETFLLYRDPDA